MKSNLFALSFLISAKAISGVTPRLYIQPAPIFDMLCQQTPFKIDAALQSNLQKELDEKLKDFQFEWDKAASTIVPASEKATGRKFSRKEYSVALSLCGWIPMGDPVLLISALPYLGEPRISRGFKMPMNMNAFVSMTHHELLHSLVDNIVSSDFWNSSALLKKYSNETYNVRVHLHLMAVQKAAYQRLNYKSLLDATDQLYSFIGGDYQRSWEIIGLEGSEKFLREVQLFNLKKTKP
jgi:hypothetical protein